MAKIRKIYDEAIKPDGNKQVLYPITSTRAVYTTTNVNMDTLLNEGYRFGGVVLPTDSPVIMDQRVFYGASVPGVYTNFGGISVDGGEAIFLMYDGTSWHKGIFGGAGVNNLSGFKALASISDLPLEKTTLGYLIKDETVPAGLANEFLYVWVGEHGDTLDGLYQNCGQLRGASAYEVAVRNGYEGTEEEWLNDPVNGIKGNGIKSFEVVGEYSSKDSAENTYRITPYVGEAFDIKVKNGKGIASVQQTTTSTESDGVNIITVAFSDGTTTMFQVKNGARGNSGYSGAAEDLEVVNDLDADDPDADAAKALSAYQGYILDGKVTELGKQVIYDVTMNNSNHPTFASLSALLSDANLSTLIPANVRCGGMSIRFVQTSDNKYVQYFLTRNTWSVSEDNWEKMNLEEEVSQLSQMYVYYGASAHPTFEKKSDGSIDIIFPNRGFNVYTRNGDYPLGAVTTLNNQTINVPTTKALVLNFSDKSYEVVTFNEVTESRILLFANTYNNAYDGALASYYYKQILDYHRDGIGTFIYWQSNGRPTFSFASNGTTVNITFPNTNFHIYRKGDGKVVNSSASGKGQTFAVEAAKVLVYDISDSTVKVASIEDNFAGGCYLLFSNSAGSSFDGLIAPYYYAMKSRKVDLSAYFIGGRKPDFYVSGTTITIIMPDKNLRIYSADGGIDRIISITAGQTFDIPSVYKLVFDLADNTIKVVGSDSVGLYVDLITNNNLMVSGLLAIYYTQDAISVVNLYNTQREKLCIQALNKRNVSGVTETGYYPLVLLHFSDIHEDRENLQRIMNYYAIHGEGINNILNTGDTINDYTDGYDYFTAIQGTENILTAIGNHDVKTGHAGLDVYNLEIAPFVDNWGVVQPANAATLGLCYYYKDYTDSNVRLIVLDNFATDMPAQTTWLQGVLSDAKAQGLCVVCAGHFPCPMNDLYKQTTFCSIDGDEISVDRMQASLISAVDAFIQAGGNFACWLTGHTHSNLVGKVTGYDDQLCITIASASDARNSDSIARVAGTQSQDLFNIIAIDENKHCINVHRVGANRDRYMRLVDGMSFDYQTHTFVNP